MKEQIENILIKVDEGTMPVQQALNELLILFSVSGRSEQLKAFAKYWNKERADFMEIEDDDIDEFQSL